MSIGFKSDSSSGRGLRLLAALRGGSAKAATAAVVPLPSSECWEPLSPELEDWMGMNPFVGDQPCSN